jgi:hypothetical protein
MEKLSKENFELIMKGFVKNIYLEDMICAGYVEKTPLMCKDDFGKYDIHINSIKDEAEQKITLVHEVEHIRRGVGKAASEEDIDAEAKRFYNEYPETVEQFYRKAANRHFWEVADEWMRNRAKSRQDTNV